MQGLFFFKNAEIELHLHFVNITSSKDILLSWKQIDRTEVRRIK